MIPNTGKEIPVRNAEGNEYRLPICTFNGLCCHQGHRVLAGQSREMTLPSRAAREKQLALLYVDCDLLTVKPERRPNIVVIISAPETFPCRNDEIEQFEHFSLSGLGKTQNSSGFDGISNKSAIG